MFITPSSQDLESPANPGRFKITKENVTADQKAKLIAGATELIQRVLNKNPATTVAVIDEAETDNWGIGGEQVTHQRKKGLQ